MLLTCVAVLFVGIFGARFRIKLYQAGNFKYDSGHNFFPVEDRFPVDIEQVRKGLVVFGVTESEYDDGLFFDEGQTEMWGWDL